MVGGFVAAATRLVTQFGHQQKGASPETPAGFRV